MISTIVTKKVWLLVLIDALAFITVYFLPAISHLTTIPLYIIEPMRLMILVSLIVFNNKKNALLLAMTLPLFSFAIATHPLFIKALLISIELVSNIIIYSIIIRKIDNPFWPLLLSIFASKLIYYFLKYCFIVFGWMTMTLVSTSLIIQFVVVLATAILFGVIIKYSK